MQWLTEDLKTEVRKVFEPQYKKHLTDEEVEEVAKNLTDFMEAYLRFKWRAKYEKK